MNLPTDSNEWFARNVEPHVPMLRAWLQSRFPQLTETEDILQDAFARVLAARSHGEVRAPKAFLFATARNLALDYFRRAQLTRTESLGGIDELSVLDEGVDVAELAARNQEIEIMTLAIQSLPARCRQIMTLRSVYNMPHREIAAQLGISVRTVEAQMTIGIKRCTEFVRRHVRR